MLSPTLEDKIQATSQVVIKIKLDVVVSIINLNHGEAVKIFIKIKIVNGDCGLPDQNTNATFMKIESGQTTKFEIALKG